LPTPWRRGTLGTLLRLVWGIGIRSPRRRALWGLVARALRRGPLALARAAALAVRGEHLLRYTEEVALPRLDLQLAALKRETADGQGGLPSQAAAASLG
jgi:hypothetical protein